MIHQVGRETPIDFLGVSISPGQTRVHNMVPLPSWPNPYEV
ncbi:hypothetical protein ACFLWI_03670 [Chloroflexota bacterium]